MRKRPLFALGMWSAALLGLVYLTLVGQVLESAQSPRPQASEQQSTKSSGPQSATKQSQPLGKQGASQTGKQTSGQNAGQRPQAPPAPVIPPGFRLLSLTEGRAIAQGISWANDEEGLSPDCSHLVHHLYEQAGYTYPYVSSLDLYRGTGQFLRVRYAQPGDLVVWQGHVGIVVDPKEHSFFSTTHSGVRTLNYRSAYWQARGYPRFFRYLTKSPLKGAAASEASNRSSGVQPKEQAVRGGGGVGSGRENRPGLQTVKAVPGPTAGPTGRATYKSRSETVRIEAGASKAHEETTKSREETTEASRARVENTSRTSSTRASTPG